MLAGTLLSLSYRYLRHFSGLAAAILVLLPLVFPGPALVMGRVYAPLDLHYNSPPLKPLREELEVGDHQSSNQFDVAFEMIPLRKATRFAIKNGEWPILNPFILSGDILAAAAQPAVYHPVNLLSYLVPLGPSLSFVASAVLLLGALSAFFFNREVGCRESAALFGAAAWTFCGFQLFWIGWPLALTVAVFPFLLLSTRRVARSPGCRSAALLAAAFILLLLGGHPESAFHAVAVACAYGLFEVGVSRRRKVVASVAAAFCAAFVALLLCAVYLLPLLEALPQTAQYQMRRGMASKFGRRSVEWELAVRRVQTAPISFAYGFPWDRDSRRPQESGPHWYAGTIVWPLAIFGLWRGRWRARWLIAGLAIGGFLVHISAPGLIDVLAQLPLFDMAVNQRLIFVTAFAVSVLAALGAEVWAGRTQDRSAGWIALATLGTSTLLIALYWSDLRAAGLTSAELSARTLLECAPLAVVAVILFKVTSARLAMALLVAVLVGQRSLEATAANPTYEERHFAPEVHELAALPREGPPYRIVGLGQSLPPNLATLYELEDVRGKQAMTHDRYYRTYGLWARRRPGSPHIAIVDDLTKPFLSFLNVRFAVVGRRAPRGGWSEVARGRGFSILENPAVLERAFVPQRIRFVPPGTQVVREMEDETDFSYRAWIEDDVGREREVTNGPGRVTPRRHNLGLHLDVDMDGDGWLVVSQTFWKGWRATVAGRDLALRPANYAFFAFYLPAGRHSVALFYRPQSLVVGCWISLLTALASLSFLLLSWLRERTLR